MQLSIHELLKFKYFPTGESFFSGGGGLDYGVSLAGIKIQRSYEIDPTCVSTLRKNFSHEIVETDIRNLTVTDRARVDIMFGTFPCQKYSNAADIHATRTGDDLFLHYFRQVALGQPEAYVVENVPGMRKFQVVMEALTKLPNYYVRVECPVDVSSWLPQKRPRLVIIGTKKPFYNIESPPGYCRMKLKDLLEKDPDIKIPNYVYNRLLGIGNYRDKPIITDPEIDDMSPMMLAHYSKDRSTRLIKDKNFLHGVRPYTVKEAARLQGFPDSFKFSGSESQQFTQIGNAVGVPVGEYIGRQLLRYFN
jgi:DNA (cytosine-5)-methyltransferase 1